MYDSGHHHLDIALLYVLDIVQNQLQGGLGSTINLLNLTIADVSSVPLPV